MTIRHHISEDLLLAHACGQLPEAFNLVVAAHLSLCDECRARAGALDAVGGAVLDAGAPETIADETIEAALVRIMGAPRDTARPATRPRGVLPAPLPDYIGGDLDAVRWRSVGMGVRQAILQTDRDATARLLYIPAGAAMPGHGHGGLELTMVLQGAFLDDGRRYGPGDVDIADEATRHTPVAEVGADCICLAAADAKLRFSGLLPRLAQPFFRI
ncbi:MAG: ChrR family anti-sigma-E factor [Gemmobacter sp.]